MFPSHTGTVGHGQLESVVGGSGNGVAAQRGAQHICIAGNLVPNSDRSTDCQLIVSIERQLQLQSHLTLPGPQLGSVFCGEAAVVIGV